MNELLSVAPDRVAGGDDSIADRADHLGAFGVMNTTVGAEDDVLAGLHPEAAECTGGEFCCHISPLGHDQITTHEKCQGDTLAGAFHRVPERRAGRRTSWHLARPSPIGRTPEPGCA